MFWDWVCNFIYFSEITDRESSSPKNSDYPDSLKNRHIRELTSFNPDFTDTTSKTEISQTTIFHSGNLISNFEESSRYSSSSETEYLTVDFDDVSSYGNFGNSILDNEVWMVTFFASISDSKLIKQKYI